MIYSSAIGILVSNIKGQLGPEQQIAKRIELSDPKEFNEELLRTELGYQKFEKITASTDTKPFAKPRGPVRKR